MGFLNHRVPAPRPVTADPNAQFRCDDAREVLALLCELRDTSTPLVLSCPAGAALAATVWTVDAGRGCVGLDVEPADPALRTVVDADEASVVGYLASVKLQFDLHDLMLVRSARASLLQARLPESLWRFQRRASYRVRTLERSAPLAHFAHPGMPDMALSLRILDVSTGGCALLLPEDVPPVPLGMTLHHVKLDLDASTQLRTSLVLQHASSLQAPMAGLRLGCELPSLDAEARRRLQRYIDNTQKRRRQLALE